MSLQYFKLPDVGEGLTEAEILGWHVKPGDVVKVNQIIVEIETAKAAVELPCPYEGTVTELLVNEGDTVEVGTPIIGITSGAPTQTPPQLGANHPRPNPDAPSSGSPAMSPDRPAQIHSRPEPVLVGYGVREPAATRRARPAKPAEAAAAPTAAVSPVVAVSTAPVSVGAGGGAGGAGPAPASAGPASASPAAAGVAGAAGPAPALPAAPAPAGSAPVSRSGGTRVLAKPPVRKLAKDLGIDITTVVPTGSGGIVTRDDVQRAVKTSGAAAAGALSASVSSAGSRRVPIRSVRKATAAAVAGSAFTAPHVTEFLTIDVTPTMKLVRRLRELPDFADVKVSPLLLVAKALLLAVRRNPDINARWDEAAGEIEIFDHVNLGIAAATPRGLIVPNIKAADTLTLPALATALGDLTRVAREGRTSPAELTGGTITITNVGVFGVDTGTPILNPGEAAILAFGAIREQPWVVPGKNGKSKVKPRQVTTLGLSFDHRLVDGELGSKFLRDIGTVLADPTTALAWS
jgi:pyruvate dehydrogenase E2 component (dihydrolipoamide acetyltransferase)